MDYLARNSADLPVQLWEKVDAAVTETAKKHLVCRRFLHLFGPLGAGASNINIDSCAKTEVLQDGVGRITGRQIAPLPLFYEDFTLLWRDLAEAQKNHLPLDLSPAIAAAGKSARREDDLILFGNEALGCQGLMTAAGAHRIQRTDWNQGENGFRDVAAGISHLIENGYLGRYALVLSPDLTLALHRLQPSAGLLELDRVSKLVHGNIYTYGNFGTGKAVLVCAEPEYMDLAVGLDLSVGYLELKDFNHYFRIMETIALRIKNPDAIVVLE